METIKNIRDVVYNGKPTQTDGTFIYYVYTVYDIECDMYYIGSRKSSTIGSDIGVKYFTSSTNREFVTRFKRNPEKFKTSYSFFKTSEEANIEEVRLHVLYRVDANPKFYNKAIVQRGELYQKFAVTSIETEKRMVISYDEFDPNIYKGDQRGNVNCIDSKTGKRIRISKEEFDANPSLIGVSKGKVSVYDTEQKITTMVGLEEFRNNSRYVGVSKGMIRVFDNIEQRYTQISPNLIDGVRYSKIKNKKYSIKNTLTGEIRVVNCEEYKTKFEKDVDWILVINDPNILRPYKNTETNQIVYMTVTEAKLHEHIKKLNCDIVVALDKSTGKIVNVPKEEFDANPSLIGVTSGKSVVYDIITKTKHQIDKNIIDTVEGKNCITFGSTFDKIILYVHNGMVIKSRHLVNFFQQNKICGKQRQEFKEKYKVFFKNFNYSGEEIYAPNQN